MENIEHLEHLSRLEFSEEEKAEFAGEFENIIKFVDEIATLELPEGLDKDEAISLDDLRADEPEQSMSREEVLLNTPKQKDGQYVTPLVVE